MSYTGIFGGSFNPIHDGHCHIANEAYEQMGLDKIMIIVTPKSPHKDQSLYVELEHRMNMTNIMTADRPWAEVRDTEKYFSNTDSADTITILSEMHPGEKMVWIMGADGFSKFHTWEREKHKVDDIIVPDWKYIMHNFSIAVMTRPGAGTNALNSNAAKDEDSFRIIDPRDIKNNQTGWCFIDNKPLDISSSQILRDIRSGKEDICGLPNQVNEYIKKHSLYTLNNEFNSQSPTSLQGSLQDNIVPMEVFILLARATNFIKSISTVSANEAEQYYEICCKKSVSKGDFNKKEEIKGEIADCLISLQWLASAQNIELNLSADGNETQYSVTKWCDEHYPNEDIKQRTLNFIEELAELNTCIGLSLERAQGFMSEIFSDSFINDLDVTYRNTIDGLSKYAGVIGADISNILDEKMKTNRNRIADESRERLRSKQYIMHRIK